MVAVCSKNVNEKMYRIWKYIMKIFKEIYLAINIFPEISSLHILIFATFFQQIIFACSRKKIDI